MSRSLLAKEKEFYRLNEELEQKTRDLMKEVNSVIYSHEEGTCMSNCISVDENTQWNNSLLENVNNNTDTKHNEEEHKPCTPLKNNFVHLQRSFSQKQDIENESPDTSSDQVTENEAVTKFLKAKIKMLQEELHNMKLEYVKQCNLYKDLTTECKKQDESKKKLGNQILSLKQTISKLETLNASYHVKIQEQNTDIATLKKEIEDLKKELRISNQQSASCDIRLQRSLEENDKLKSALKFNQSEEKELRDQIRKLQNSRTMEIKTLEKQRSDILQAFKRQTHLVDNLKKQKAYLEACKQIQLAEADFLKFLQWEPDQK